MTDGENMPKNPLGLLAKPIEELLNSQEFKDKIDDMDFLNNLRLDGKKHQVKNMNAVNKNKALVEVGNRIVLATKKSDTIITAKTNFKVTNCVEIVLKRKDKIIREEYALTLKTTSGKVINVNISDKAKMDPKAFSNTINELTNGLNNTFTQKEFIQFVNQFVVNKVSRKVVIYGTIGDIGNNIYLLKNACIKDGKVYYADNVDCILIDKDGIKVDPDLLGCPKLTKSERPAKEVACDLINNLKAAWGASMAIPILICGYAVMCTRYSLFANTYGFPTLMLFGDSGSGKSTCTALAAGILGYDRTALLSGSSTLLSQMQLASERVNSIVIIDDLKSVMNDKKELTKFVSTIKTLFNGQARKKMSKDQKIDGIEITSPIVFSSNEPPIALREIENRCLTLNVFKGHFNPSEYKYFDDKKLNELSALLPDILSYSEKQIIELYKEIKGSLKPKFSEDEDRILSNYAIALTGAHLLFRIAEHDIKELETSFDRIIKEATESYDEIDDVVENVLTLIPKLISENLLSPDDILINYDGENPQIIFHAKTVVDAYNKYYSFDSNSRILKKTFLSFARKHKRNLGKYSARINGKEGSKRRFRIDGLEEFEHLINSARFRQGLPMDDFRSECDNLIDEKTPF